ncbi:MAG: sugar phosphate isomerase/epimerase [bacterium]|nr:sugar phosphate isomerase/epimerase [bacterium]
MKLGVSMWSLHKLYRKGEMDTVGFIEYIGSLGIDGVELLEFFWKDKEKELPKVKETLTKYNLEVSAYAVSNNFVKETKAERDLEIDKIKVGVDMAIEFNSKIVRVFSGDLKPPFTYEQAKEWIIEGLKEGAKYAEKHGVTLALENHGLLAGKSSQVREIIELVGSNYFRATVDIGNFLLVGESSVNAVKNLVDVAVHVHLKDFKRVPPDYEGEAYRGLEGVRLIGTVAGEGEVNLPEVLKVLYSSGYRGYLSLEYEGPEDPKYGVEQSIKNTKKILENMR